MPENFELSASPDERGKGGVSGSGQVDEGVSDLAGGPREPIAREPQPPQPPVLGSHPRVMSYFLSRFANSRPHSKIAAALDVHAESGGDRELLGRSLELTTSARDRIFLPEMVSAPEVAFLLPHDAIIGQAFVSCQNDTRSYISDWVRDIRLEGEPSLEGLPKADKDAADLEPQGIGPSLPDDDALFLSADEYDSDFPRSCRDLLVLTNPRTKLSDELAKEWLIT